MQKKNYNRIYTLRMKIEQCQLIQSKYQMKSGWTLRAVSFFRHVGHFLPPASSSTPFIHSSQKTWPHVVAITLRPAVFTSLNESKQIGQNAPVLLLSVALPMDRFLRGEGVGILNGTGGSSSSLETLPSLTSNGDCKSLWPLAAGRTADVLRFGKGLLSKSVRSTNNSSHPASSQVRSTTGGFPASLARTTGCRRWRLRELRRAKCLLDDMSICYKTVPI